MQEEAYLLRRAQKGDAEAFETLLAPHEKKIYGLCLRMLGSREDALDCAQDAMLRIWRSLKSYRKEASFTTWIYRIATNACLDLIRKRKVRPSVSLEMMTELGYSPVGDADNPQEYAEARARKQALEVGLSQLTPDHRAALILRDIQGLPYEEVASVLQVSLGTAKSRISRAREKLREILHQHGELFEMSRVQTNERRKET